MCECLKLDRWSVNVNHFSFTYVFFFPKAMKLLGSEAAERGPSFEDIR